MTSSPNKVDNSEFATDATVPDSPDILNMPVGWRVIVRPLPPQEKTKGGIIRIDTHSQELTETVGKLVAIGPLSWKDERSGGVNWAELNDHVMFGKWAGKRFEYGGVKYVLLNDDEIIARVPDVAKVKR